jgi:hypothetical protein
MVPIPVVIIMVAMVIPVNITAAPAEAAMCPSVTWPEHFVNWSDPGFGYLAQI